MAFAFHKRSPEMVSTLEKSDPDGQDPPGKRRMEPDHAVSTNKHLTRLVRFSILQARRSSQSPKAGGTPTSGSSKPPFPVAGVPSPSRGSSNHRQRSPSPRSSTPPSQQQQQSPSSAKYPFAFGSFPQDKERPSTEVQYPYNNDAPGQVISQTGMVAGHVVDVPADPPIVVDLSASLTLSVGDEEDQRSVYSGESISDGLDAISAQEDHDHDDMDLLLAPDSGSADGHLIMNENSSDEVYNSAEMYSSSGNYEGASQSSGMSSTSDSIMRRVEQEIANARKASNDAQARLAYFTQKQKELTPVMTDSYSFDFENLETSGDLHNMLDVGSDEAATPRHQNNPSAWSSLRDDNKSPRSPPPPGSYHHASRSPPARNYHFSPRSPVPAQHAQEDSYNNAMGVIGREFDTSSADVEEKVDIEVVLAPSHNQNPQQRDDREPHPPQPPQSPTFRGLHAASKKQQRNTPPPQRSPRVLSPGHQQRLRSPRGQLNMDDSVDIDEAVISAVFSEKSIESLPIKESLHEVFSEPSMDSLPTQPTQSSIERPGSIDASYTESQSRAMSPSSLSQRKQQFMLSPNGKNATSPSSQHSQQQQKQQRSLQSHLSIETSGSASIASPRNSVCSPKANSVSSPLSNVVTTPNSGTFSPGRRSSKLPRRQGIPAHPHIENALKTS
ncbi:expressed unknown protein [Seminavis robusta]|uniref:Uncharacterized protein n=1 Tax=Seminavis robusta TaxID=568900 RepID=A0A9N8HKT3_9STRA|nr:expressed unknown protein [Seminavis robusta]|eukprot:Sro757_g197990.1 n/a (669) ;mRNA; f:41715-43721